MPAMRSSVKTFLSVQCNSLKVPKALTTVVHHSNTVHRFAEVPKAMPSKIVVGPRHITSYMRVTAKRPATAARIMASGNFGR